MKKFCILMACLMFASVMPSFALKVIVNNDKDRIVYSRSSMYEKDHYIDEYYIQKHQEELAESSYLRRQDPNKYEEQMRLLGDDFRLELAGTKWYYPEEQAEVPIANVETQAAEEQNPNAELYKRGSREAADYYYIDYNVDPNNAIQSGYDL